jgi:hypothetical protein
MTYKLVNRIKSTGWPVRTKSGKIRKGWKRSHMSANAAEKKKFGDKAFAAVQRVAKRLPKDELLGSHTKAGKIKVSKVVPKHLRSQIAFHERVEHRLMTKRKK